MVRTQIQLTSEQYRRLKRSAQQRSISLSEAIRRCVDAQLDAERGAPTRALLVSEALQVAGTTRTQRARPTSLASTMSISTTRTGGEPVRRHVRVLRAASRHRTRSPRGTRRIFRGAAERGRKMVTTNYVLVETAALLQHRIGLAPVRDLEERLLPLVTVQWVSSELHRRAVERLFRTDKRKLSLVDVVTFTVMDAEGLTDVLGLDPDSTAEGFRLLP